MTLRNVNEIKTEVATALRELAGLAGESGAASLHERILVDRLPRLASDISVVDATGSTCLLDLSALHRGARLWAGYPSYLTCNATHGTTPPWRGSARSWR